MAETITSLRRNYPIEAVLEEIKLQSSSFYSILKQIKNLNKDDILIAKIREIWTKSRKTYGYRRIMLALRRENIFVNHKKINKLMRENNMLVNSVRPKKFNSYKGSANAEIKNLIQRNFKSEKPFQKIFTDVTEVKIKSEKLYISVVTDGFNNEILGKSYSRSPSVEFVHKSLLEAFSLNKDKKVNCCFHSDQGFQYSNQSTKNLLLKFGYTQSMSRKGNCYDNGLQESIFSLMKNELFYLQKNKYRNIEEFKIILDDWFKFYNNERIRTQLNGMSPVEYRLKNDY